jgi:hypothetical protein
MRESKYTTALPLSRVPIWFGITLALAVCSRGYAQLTPDDKSRGNCNNFSTNNTGSIIQNCPIVQQAVTPTFRVLEDFPVEDNQDGTFVRSTLIRIDAPYVPGNMVVVASGATVKDLHVTNAVMMSGGPSTGSDPNYHGFYVFEPYGRYTIEVVTSDKRTPVSISIAFNQDVNVK